jgi:hypothetical protein|tara:strand:- start:1503 stop:3125 length:1623 start_codon:yes stop_codon:yes gene_type:complete
MAMTNPFDPLSQQLDDMNSAFMRDPSKAQKAVSTLAPNTLEALAAQRVLTAHAKEKRKLQEELFMNKAGNPDTTVNDDLKTGNVKLANDLTSLELDRVKAVGELGKTKQLEERNALNRLVAASKGGNNMGGIGAILGNASPVPNRGVNTLPTANMRGMQPGGITPNRAPMGMPMANRMAGGGIVAFNKSGLVEDKDEALEELRRVAANNPKGQTPTPQTSTSTTPKTDPNNIFIDSQGKQLNLDNPNDFIQVFRNQQNLKAKRLAARRADLEEQAEGEKGLFSPDFINRLTSFAGAPSLAQGIIQAQQAVAPVKQARRSEINKLLAGLDTADVQSDNALLSALSNFRSQDIQKNIAEAELTLNRDKFNQSTINKEVELKATNERFMAELNFKIADANTKNALTAQVKEVDRLYKEGLLALNADELMVDRNRAAVALMSHYAEFMDAATTALMEGTSAGKTMTPAEISLEIKDYDKTFKDKFTTTLEQIKAEDPEYNAPTINTTPLTVDEYTDDTTLSPVNLFPNKEKKYAGGKIKGIASL